MVGAREGGGGGLWLVGRDERGDEISRFASLFLKGNRRLF